MFKNITLLALCRIYRVEGGRIEEENQLGGYCNNPVRRRWWFGLSWRPRKWEKWSIFGMFKDRACAGGYWIRYKEGRKKAEATRPGFQTGHPDESQGHLMILEKPEEGH